MPTLLPFRRPAIALVTTITAAPRILSAGDLAMIKARIAPLDVDLRARVRRAMLQALDDELARIRSEQPDR